MSPFAVKKSSLKLTMKYTKKNNLSITNSVLQALSHYYFSLAVVTSADVDQTIICNNILTTRNLSIVIFNK